ncbi:uncharacterized protein LOC141621218 [Silene latifolia]|uniref:uncharacterized protein LOC141621218 n=1 Tax=Silene latifolia TaxID=37657 RepID=UPI003D771489
MFANIFKPIVLYCVGLLIVPFIQAAYFQPCYYNVDYSLKIQRVSVFTEPSSQQQEVSIRYKAYSDVRIPKGKVRVDTFLTSESSQDVQNSNSHPFCRDTECPIEQGDHFDAEFRQIIPRNYYGSMTLLVRVVNQVSGRELTCIVVNFDTYYDRDALKAN